MARFVKAVLLVWALLLVVPGALATSVAGEDQVEGAAKGASPAASRAKSGALPDRAELEAMVDRIATRHGVERALARAVVAAESAYDPEAVSRAGAIGLMQVMPTTAADYGVADRQALFDPETNVETGMRHLSRLLDKYDDDYGRVIMAYNAGEGVVDRTNSRVTYRETLDYTVAVIHSYRRNGGTRPTEEALKKVALLRRVSGQGQARRLMKRYLDPSLLSLKIQPTLTLRQLDPGLHRAGPESRPMFELEPRR